MRDPFQDAFTQALAGDAAALSAWWIDPQRGEAALSVYRNTVAKGCADAIVSLFPTVERIVGADWLQACAVRYAAERPPRRPALIDYGDDFPDWLAAFEPAADMPYLPDLARLDRLWTEAHMAADADPMEAAAFAAVRPDDYAQVNAEPHPSLRLALFDHGAPALWATLRGAGDAPETLELSADPQAIAILRPGGEVSSLVIEAGTHAFLQACQTGVSLADAAASALTAQPDLALAAALRDLIVAGAFIRLRPIASTDLRP